MRYVTYILTTGYREGSGFASDNYHIVACLRGPTTPSLGILEQRFRAHFGVVPKSANEAPEGEVDPATYWADIRAWEERHNAEFERAELNAGLSSVLDQLRAEGIDEAALEHITCGRPARLVHAFACWLERDHGFSVFHLSEHNTLDLGHYHLETDVSR